MISALAGIVGIGLVLAFTSGRITWRGLRNGQGWYGEDGAVVGVVYELDTCLDLMDSSSIRLVKEARAEFEKIIRGQGLPMPANRDLKSDANKDKLLRMFDCSVINFLTGRMDLAYIEDVKSSGFSKMRAFDSVRGCFNEGKKIEGMEIYEKTHIQIAIRNMNCIKGVFLPRQEKAFPVGMVK